MAETRFQAQIKETVAGEAKAVVRETATEMRFRSHSSYAALNMLEKADFLRFNGDNIEDWLFRIEQFFLIDRTPEELKVGIASIHFNDIAATLHQSIVQSMWWKHVRHDWWNYKLMLQVKYNQHVEDSIAKLKLLQETEEIEVEMESIGLEDNLVHGAILEEESTPQFQVSIANSEILRSSELREANLEFDNLDDVVMHENLEQVWIQKNIHKLYEVHGDVEKSQNVISNTKKCCAHQVFGKMSKHEEKLGIKKKRKGFKSWMFKYKRGLRKLHALTFFKSMRMVFSQQLGMVETSSDLLMWNGKYSLPRTAIGSHVTMAFVFKQTSLSYSPCIEHNLLDTMLLRCHSKKKQRKCQKSWMFKYKFDEEDPWNLQSRTGYSLSRREIQPFISQYMWTQEVSAAIRFLLRRHLYLNFDCEELALAGRKKRKHGLPMGLQSKQKKRKCPKSWQLLIGSNSCVSTLGKRKLGKDWWFKYKTAAMAKNLLMMKLSQAWRFKSARLFFYPNNRAVRFGKRKVMVPMEEATWELLFELIMKFP
ncbi:hypothetical protein ISN44_As10g010980 [Arabidopsis suecica]|uniref:Uncharacterized protein n=1 Tax=Arabidopsis suecica TaxID=45249 RepID=A0A8T1ZXJ0_ARASU|nr:hypothetical protein ISN44_As10g010980 [Arabidopsis suecica]